MDNFGCKMSKITQTMKKGLQLWVQEVMWAGTRCYDFPKQDYYIAIYKQLCSIVSQSLLRFKYFNKYRTEIGYCRYASYWSL